MIGEEGGEEQEGGEHCSLYAYLPSVSSKIKMQSCVCACVNRAKYSSSSSQRLVTSEGLPWQSIRDREMEQL